MGRRFVTLRVWHEGCWMLDLTERHRDVTVTARGVSSREGLMHAHAAVCACHPQALRDALDARVPDDVSRELLHVGNHQAEVYSTYPHSRSIYEATRQSGFLVVGEVTHQDGYERWQVVADPEELPVALSALRESAEVRVERVAETPPVSPPPSEASADFLDRLNERLTPRQLDMLLAAVERNYYAWPRGRSPTALAEELGLSAPTCLEHIRRGESRLLPDLVRELVARRRRKERTRLPAGSLSG